MVLDLAKKYYPPYFAGIARSGKFKKAFVFSLKKESSHDNDSFFSDVRNVRTHYRAGGSQPSGGVRVQKVGGGLGAKRHVCLRPVRCPNGCPADKISIEANVTVSGSGFLSP